MAFQTGTANCALDLVHKLNTFLVANSWTKLDGETDIVPASPKTARYWRIVVHQTEDVTADFREFRSIHLRTVTGGANVAVTEGNWSFSSLNGTSDLVNTGLPATISLDIDDNIWWCVYDFGVGTIIREIVMEVDTDNYAPSAFSVQWSNDSRTWTTMYRQTGLAWVDNETKTFTWDTGAGYTDTEHYSATIARRTGEFRDSAQSSEANNDIWAWQGTGYDVTRRVYIGCLTEYNLSTSTEWVKLFATTDYDNTFHDHETQENFDVNDNHYHSMSSAGVTYWFYVNTSRLVIVTKSGTDDYTASYVGFLAAFAQPDEWSQPLFVGATNDDRQSLSDASGRNSGFFNPGNNGCAKYYDWVNVWRTCENREDNSDRRMINSPDRACVWPWHTGSSYGSSVDNWPAGAVTGSWGRFYHWLDKLEPTDQNELPIIPAMVVDNVYGNIGALDEIYAIPGGGLVTPEQTIVLGADTYRVFPNRTERDGDSYWAILEV